MPGAPSAPRLSLVVLPFANIGGDPGQDYFADGVTESLTTDLSRIAGSFVIARNTAFTFKGKALDVKQIGRELNVRYVLEGSVQRAGTRLRVNVQLIDAGTGNHLWAERFDKPVADLFDMQDEIVSRLANALDIQLIAAEARRSERSLHPDAMDLCFQGMACFYKGLTNEYLDQSRGLYERALALDPGNVEALVGIANANAAAGVAHMTDDRSARLAVAEATLIKALSIAPQHARAHASGHAPDFNEPRRARYCQMRGSLDAGSKFCFCARNIIKISANRDQWLIIHGRAVGKLLPPLLVFFTSREGLVEQQPQPGPCEALYSPTVLGALAERSLVAWALRLSLGMQKKFGAVRITRGASPVHCGQSCGASHSAIGRMSVNGPQSLQRYS